MKRLTINGQHVILTLAEYERLVSELGDVMIADCDQLYEGPPVGTFTDEEADAFFDALFSDGRDCELAESRGAIQRLSSEVAELTRQLASARNQIDRLETVLLMAQRSCY